MAFLAGVLAAAILQSNTGATMMVITLAGAGALKFSDAALMIYGTNLGAIALRLVLGAGMKGTALRLVRFEDLFCLWSGIVMLVLFYVEATGVPLVFTLAHAIAPAPQQALAVVFTLSNLLPALIMLPFLPQCWKLLEHLWPGDPAVTPGKPRFLVPQALEHPSVALDLLRRELANLMGFLESKPISPQTPTKTPASDSEEPAAAFVRLSENIEKFSIKLATQGNLNETQTGQVQRLRAALSGIRHLEEAIRFYRNRRGQMQSSTPANCEKLDATLNALLHRTVQALDQGDAEALQALLLETKRHGPTLEQLRAELSSPGPTPTDIEFPALMEDFELVAWTFHRVLKILVRVQAGHILSPTGSSSTVSA
jgi:phosphate:Na+ symporter